MPGMPGAECGASVLRVSFPFYETVDIVDCVAALPMTPGWHAERAPDGQAIVMGGTGETVSYAQLDERSSRLARALRSRGLRDGGHIAILMENNRAFLEVAWAAQRSGLRYTAINSHLRPAEVQYVLDDCGALALVTSEAMAGVVAGLDLARIPVRICAAGELAGFERYDDVLAGAVPGPLDGQTEGREMLYSSGTTGRPKGVRKQLPGTAFGDPASAPTQIAQGMGRLGFGTGAVFALEQAAAALRYVADGRAVGKVVLDVSAPAPQWPDRAGTSAST